MSILVAFLVVARVQITYGRFMEARGYLGGIFKSFRELMHTVAVLTDHSKSEAAKEWRKKVALRILTTLRVTVAALEVSHLDLETKLVKLSLSHNSQSNRLVFFLSSQVKVPIPMTPFQMIASLQTW